MDMYQWTADLSINHSGIDKQHQELFRAINRIMKAMKAGQGTSNVMEMVAFLDRYVIEHFALEERYMTTNAYPDYAAHKAEHDGFVKELSGIKQMIAENRTSIAVLLEVQQSTCTWLKDHIKMKDKALGEYLRKRPASNS